MIKNWIETIKAHKIKSAIFAFVVAALMICAFSDGHARSKQLPPTNFPISKVAIYCAKAEHIIQYHIKVLGQRPVKSEVINNNILIQLWKGGGYKDFVIALYAKHGAGCIISTNEPSTGG